MKSVFLNKITNFFYTKTIELIGICVITLSILLLISLVSYTPEDPNLIVPDETEDIKNILGKVGSYVSDFVLQTIGLISFMFSASLLIWGIQILKKKKIDKFLQKIFFSIIYIILGSCAINLYGDYSFWLRDNGLGGFLGEIINNFLLNYWQINNSFYIMSAISLLSLFFFFISIDFKINTLFKILISIGKLGKFFLSFFKKNKNNIEKKLYLDDSDKENQKENKPVIKQQNLPFQSEEKKVGKKPSYTLPGLNFLEKNSVSKDLIKKNYSDSEKSSDFLEKILLDFGVEGKIKRISYGPVVTLNEFEPAPGIKVSRIINLSDDIARNTSSISTRVATIPGKNTIGIEIPNSKREKVFLRDILSDVRFENQDIKLPIALGKSISGVPIVGDLAAMPHLLIAGTTGSGKSICINTIILSLLYRHNPENCKFILIDPKMLELSTYEGIPHLLCPVITEAKKATAALSWVTKEMSERYKKMSKYGVKNIEGYNSKTKNIMPFIIVIVDEMSDLMLISGKEIENYIQKLSAMARAAGIHIIMATQRPSVDVITGIIKANFVTRISFQVSSKIDSRTILGEQGAEQLLGKGDMLFMSSANRIIRIHGPFVSENEIEKINSFIRSQAEPEYISEITNFENIKNLETNEINGSEKDDLYFSAVELVKTEGKASTSFLQRKLQIGYNRAARIVDMMEEDGIVSKANHVGKREIL